jgi:hypothetical protein
MRRTSVVRRRVVRLKMVRILWCIVVNKGVGMRRRGAKEKNNNAYLQEKGGMSPAKDGTGFGHRINFCLNIQKRETS